MRCSADAYWEYKCGINELLGASGQGILERSPVLVSQKKVKDAREGGVREPAEEEVHCLCGKLECKLHHWVSEGATKLERRGSFVTGI